MVGDGFAHRGFRRILPVMVQPSAITLVPQSGIQFMELRFALDRLPRSVLPFWEKPGAIANERQQVALVALASDELGTPVDPKTGSPPPDDETYSINRALALETYLNRWVPAPFFRVRGRNPDGSESFERGPSNWARVRLSPLPEPDRAGNTHMVILAFDTGLVPRVEGTPYTGLSPEDNEREFAPALKQDPASWFLNEPWVAEWLAEVLQEAKLARRGGRPLRPEDMRFATEHWARYLALLDLLEDAAILPRVRCIDVTSANRASDPIGVDLVIDIGNSRSCGILVEADQDQRADFASAYSLRLRDLSMPERTYSDPFESRVEFARASFGRDALSRRSGRGNAFAWLSPVRVGPEAVRLSAASTGNGGATGISSPKRYVWDRRPPALAWRFNGVTAEGAEPPVTGAFMRFVTEEGEVLRAIKGRGSPAVRARFSRSSLFTFMLAELVIQALVQMNAPDNRAARRFAEVPRRLRRLVLTMPIAMPLAEQRIFRARAEAAVRLAWDMMGWAEGTQYAPPLPQVVANMDEATATQLIFLYAEASQRLRGDLDALFKLYGRVRQGYGTKPSLRIASIDIGGGTTDLMVATYTAENGDAIVPKQNFREGFRIAGDEVLQEVIQTIVVPQIAAALHAAGVRDAKNFLRDMLGGARGGLSEPERHLRRQFVGLVLEPLALAVLHAYEAAKPRGPKEVLRAPVASLLAKAPATSPRAITYMEDQARLVGANDFTLATIELVADADAIAAVITASLGGVLADLCEVVHRFGCDWLLLSGRPSRLTAVVDAVLAKLPVPAHRILSLDGYHVGQWYPFRDPAGRISDPKTTSAVGAVLSILAEGRLPGFLMRTSRFAMRSTVRFVGRMEVTGQVKDANLVLADLNPDRAQDAPGFKLTLNAPMFLGFRQLPVERWNASPLYAVEFANPDTVARLALPLTVSVERAEHDPDDAESEVKREEFKIAEILDAEGTPLRPSDVVMRLQTMKAEAGYWRDTGALSVA